MQLRGWIEEDGRVLTPVEIEELTPERIRRCGGEFVLVTDMLSARDCYGVMPGRIPPGVIHSLKKEWKIVPDVPNLSLEDAILEAVRLRCDDQSTKSVVALSGGVDSTLIAVLADLPCIVIGFADSHDILAAVDAADRLDLSLTVCEISEKDIYEALPVIRESLPNVSHMNMELALTSYFIGKMAAAHGWKKILTGQAADELFGGYFRYSKSTHLRVDLNADFAGLAAQRARDSTAAWLSKTWYSMPYMDERVIRASRNLSDDKLVIGNLRKIALRKVAERYLPRDLAWKPKKAIQYGSGVSVLLKKMMNGCRYEILFK